MITTEGLPDDYPVTQDTVQFFNWEAELAAADGDVDTYLALTRRVREAADAGAGMIYKEFMSDGVARLVQAAYIQGAGVASERPLNASQAAEIQSMFQSQLTNKLMDVLVDGDLPTTEQFGYIVRARANEVAGTISRFYPTNIRVEVLYK